MTPNFDFGRALQALSSGFGAAAQGGFGAFGPAAVQSVAAYDQRKRSEETERMLNELRQMQIDEGRRANTEAAERQGAVNRWIDLQAGPMAPNNGRPGGPIGPMQQGWSPQKVAFARANPDIVAQAMASEYFPQPGKPRETKVVAGQLIDAVTGETIRDLSDAELKLRQAGATNVNIGAPKSIMEGDKEILTKGGEAWLQAQEILPLFSIAESAAENFDQSGPLGGAALAVERFKNYLGLENNASAGEVLQAMQTRLGTLLRVPGSGATSNYEMALYMQGVPGLMNSKAGNVALAKIGKKLTQKRMADYERFKAYVYQNGSSVGYVPDDKPVLTPEETQMLMGGSSFTPQAAPQAAPQAGAPDYSSMSDEELLKAIGVAPGVP